MGLNDEAEKLRQAGEWLRQRSPKRGRDRDRFWWAAWEHVHYVVRNTQDPVLYAQAQTLLDEIAELFRYG